MYKSYIVYFIKLIYSCVAIYIGLYCILAKFALVAVELCEFALVWVPVGSFPPSYSSSFPLSPLPLAGYNAQNLKTCKSKNTVAVQSLICSPRTQPN